MKIILMATNYILLKLDNGEIIDVNDGTSVPKGALTVKLKEPTKMKMIISSSVTYDASVRLLME